MLIAEKKRKYTIQDYMLLDEGAPFQLIDNDLIMSPAPTSLHQIISGRILFAFYTFLITTNDKSFVVAAPIDVVFNEDNVFQPDIVYVSAIRRPEVVKDRVEGAPDLVIEILSPSNAYYDLRQKKNVYEKFGVNEYIIIDPIEESAEVYSLESGLYVLRQKAQKTEFLLSVLLPGLSFDLNTLFV